ncbi:MAG: hypothetical protein HUU10_11315 [Bacteroidetes bacterium]|nr:hypothetical protein [Bacteroidota bacterium]
MLSKHTHPPDLPSAGNLPIFRFMLKPLFSLIFCGLMLIPATSGAQRSWMVISGKYATVEYPSGFETIADSLLKIAELSIPEIAAMTGVTSDRFTGKPTRIILTDAPDVSNGYAISNTVVIYATASAYVPFWTGTVNWYHQVLTHELVHHVTFRAFERKLSPWLGAGLVLDVPRWFLEGTAQYYSEYWNTYRGDLYLKNAVLEGRFSLASINSLEDGRLLYAGGHALVRYLADQYGDSSLIRLMNHEADGWVYDFNAAFKSVYGKSVADLFPDFHKHLVLYYGGRFSEWPVRKPGVKVPIAGFQVNQVVPLSPADSLYLQVARLDRNHLYGTLREIGWKQKKSEIIRTHSNTISTDVLLSPDQKWLAWGEPYRFTDLDQDGLSMTWKISNRDGSVLSTPVSGIRATNGLMTDSTLILVEQTGQVSRLIAFPVSGGLSDTLLTTPMPVGRLFPDFRPGFLLAEVQQSNGDRDVFSWSARTGLTPVTNDRVDDRLPISLNDSLLVLTRYGSEVPQATLLNRKTGTFVHSPDLAETFTIGYHPDNGVLLRSLQTGGKPLFHWMKPDSLFSPAVTSFAPAVPPARYRTWTERNPEFGEVKILPDTTFPSPNRERLAFPHLRSENLMSFALPLKDQRGWLISGFTLWIEPLQRQVLMFAGDVAVEDPSQSVLAAFWMVRAWDLMFTTSVYNGPSVFAYQGSSYLESDQTIGQFAISKSFYPGGSSRWSVTPSLSYYYHQRTWPRGTGLPSSTTLQGPEAGLLVAWSRPTLWSGALSNWTFYTGANVFQSVGSGDLTASALNLGGGIPLGWERLGLKTDWSYVSLSGKALAGFQVGTDRFYQWDVPRDYGLTRVIRGLSRDITGRQMIWGSTALNLLLAERTPLRLLVLPVNLLTIGGFTDLARIDSDLVYSVGGELGFGEGGIRFNTGYAYAVSPGVPDNETWYLQLRLSPVLQ